MKIDELLTNVNSVGISGHVNPDGDCIGSTLGVYNYIKTYYEHIDLHIYLPSIPNIFRFLSHSDAIEEANPSDGKVFDLFICCDCRDSGRLGDSKVYFKNAKRTLCIDHHIGDKNFADVEYIFPEASSASELVCELLPAEKIDQKIAECLYTGMVHDTGIFQYSCTSSKTMNVAGMLMDKGIDYSDIIDKTFYQKTFDQNRIMGLALLKAQRYHDNEIILSMITSEEMEEYHVLPKHLDGIVQQLRITKDAKVAVFIYQKGPAWYKVSTRATCDINLAEICSHFGGGGHAKAAGFDFYGDPDSFVKKILADISNHL